MIFKKLIATSVCLEVLPGRGFVDLNAAICSVSAACCEQPWLHGRWQWPAQSLGWWWQAARRLQATAPSSAEPLPSLVLVAPASSLPCPKAHMQLSPAMELGWGSRPQCSCLWSVQHLLQAAQALRLEVHSREGARAA